MKEVLLGVYLLQYHLEGKLRTFGNWKVATVTQLLAYIINWPNNITG